MVILLVHGLGRTPLSLFGLAAALRRAPHPVLRLLCRARGRRADRPAAHRRPARPGPVRSAGGAGRSLARRAARPAGPARRAGTTGAAFRAPRLAGGAGAGGPAGVAVGPAVPPVRARVWPVPDVARGVRGAARTGRAVYRYCGHGRPARAVESVRGRAERRTGRGGRDANRESRTGVGRCTSHGHHGRGCRPDPNLGYHVWGVHSFSSPLGTSVMPTTAKNVLGGPLQTCSTKPLTGFYRDGCCNTKGCTRSVAR